MITETPSSSSADRSATAPPPRSLDAILADASTETRETLRVLGELLGGEAARTVSPTAFAAMHLGVEPWELANTRFSGASTALSVFGNLLRIEMLRHGDAVVVGSPGDGLAPTWSQLDLGPDEKVSVPGRLVVFFPAGTLDAAALCCLIDDRHWTREFSILSTAADKPAAEAVLAALTQRMRTSENPLRGRVLEAHVNDGALRLAVSTAIASPRDDLVLPPEVWREIDIFLASATDRQEVLKRLGLGTNRGMLVAGPPGVGKTHLVRVIASELGGRYTTIIADANATRHSIADLYAECETFGPTLVVLDDIDLVLTHRDNNADHASLADFLATLDGVRKREDVLTIATTNDPKAIDPAAQRSSRFDMVVTLPMPDEASRERMLRGFVGPLGLPIDYGVVARALEGATGADVKEAVRRAVLEHGDTFTEAHLVEIAESGRWKANVNRRRYL